MLLSDEQAQLAREAAQAAHVLLSRGLFMLGSMPQVCRSVRQCAIVCSSDAVDSRGSGCADVDCWCRACGFGGKGVFLCRCTAALTQEHGGCSSK